MAYFYALKIKEYLFVPRWQLLHFEFFAELLSTFGMCMWWRLPVLVFWSSNLFVTFWRWPVAGLVPCTIEACSVKCHGKINYPQTIRKKKWRQNTAELRGRREWCNRHSERYIPNKTKLGNNRAELSLIMVKCGNTYTIQTPFENSFKQKPNIKSVLMIKNWIIEYI